jgi:hypothetical protein
LHKNVVPNLTGNALEDLCKKNGKKKKVVSFYTKYTIGINVEMDPKSLTKRKQRKMQIICHEKLINFFCESKDYRLWIIRFWQWFTSALPKVDQKWP